MYYLLTHSSYFQDLRKEVDDTFPFENGVSIEFAKLSSMKLLNAVMYVPFVVPKLLILLYFKVTRLFDCYQPYRLQFNGLLLKVVVGKDLKTRQWR